MPSVDYTLSSRSDPYAAELPPLPGSTVRVPVVGQDGAEIALAAVEGDADAITVRSVDPPLPEEADDAARFSGGWVRDELGTWRLVNVAVVSPGGPLRHPGV